MDEKQIAQLHGRMNAVIVEMTHAIEALERASITGTALRDGELQRELNRARSLARQTRESARQVRLQLAQLEELPF